MTTTQPAYDIVITGAGPVGCTMALLLAAYTRTPQRIALQGFFNAPPTTQRPTVRTLALNQGSLSLLASLKLVLHGADIHTVHVSQQKRLGRTLIQHDTLDVDRLGRVVAYPDLVANLQHAVQHSAITCLPQAAGTAPNTAALPSHALHIVSDGISPRQHTRHYDQHGLLAVVRASQPQAGVAYERFTREGPLALLPHPDDPTAYSLVWCCAPALAQSRQQADTAHFNADLQQQFGHRLGRLELISERHIAPLSLGVGPQWLGGRTVTIGNAAQTLHPVAGQGLNLALRDVAQLAHTLRPWLHHAYDDPSPLLASYQQRRQLDRWATIRITDFLPRAFTTGNPLVEHACGLSLLGLDLSQSLRTPLSQHLLQGLRN